MENFAALVAFMDGCAFILKHLEERNWVLRSYLTSNYSLLSSVGEFREKSWSHLTHQAVFFVYLLSISWSFLLDYFTSKDFISRAWRPSRKWGFRNRRKLYWFWQVLVRTVGPNFLKSEILTFVDLGQFDTSIEMLPERNLPLWYHLCCVSLFLWETCSDHWRAKNSGAGVRGGIAVLVSNSFLIHEISTFLDGSRNSKSQFPQYFCTQNSPVFFRIRWM